MKLARFMAYVSLAANIALAAELAALQRQLEGAPPVVKAWSLDGFIGDHVPARAYARDRSQWILAMCARQSAKSTTGDGILFDNAKLNPRSVNVLLGLNGKAVRRNNWVPIWKQRICATYGVPKRWNNETEMVCTLDNGSRVIFAGSDDYAHVLTYLGNNLSNAVFIIDEAQDQKDAVLDPLLDKILPPMMSPTTRIIMSGVIPDVPAGRFYRESLNPDMWSLHNWGRFANVHTPHARQQLDSFLKKRNLTEADPLIQRDWFGVVVFDEAARAFRYVAARNGYDGIPPEVLARLTTFSVGIDPGAKDRTAIVVLGWGEDTGLWVVEEWVTDRNSGTVWSDIGEQLKRIQAKWRPSWYYADFAGSTVALDTFGRDFGVPMIMAAKKSARRFQVDRVNDGLSTGEIHIPIGSQLEGDLIKTQWDKDERNKGNFEWSSHNHPDVADAFRYGAHAYYERTQPVVVAEDKTPSVARRLKLLKNQEQEGYFAAKRRRLG